MTALTVIEHPAVERQRLRRKLERVIDRLILTLDALDDDPDLEDGGDDEPSLSAVIPRPSDGQHGSRWFGSSPDDDDREDQCEDEGAEHDGREPEPHD